MPREDTLYRALLGLLGLVAVSAVVVGGLGVYTVLTGGTTDGDVERDVLGEFACEGFDADPEVAHEAGYDIERTVLSGTEIESFDASPADGGYRYEIAVAGELLDASARRADGTELTVDVGDENRLAVEADTATPVRVWVDTVPEDATVTRTRLDVCPTS